MSPVIQVLLTEPVLRHQTRHNLPVEQMRVDPMAQIMGKPCQYYILSLISF